MKLYNHNTLNYTYNALSQSAQKTYTALLTAGKKYRVSFDFIIDGITTATYTVINGTNTVGTKLENVTNHEVTEFTATNTNLTLVIELSAGNYGRLAHIDNLEIAEIAEVGESYRFGFNGMEKDNEMKGEGNSYDFGARIYDSRLGRWLSLDAAMKTFPHKSPYNSFSNNPIIFVDPDGNTDFYYKKRKIGTDGKADGLVAIVDDKAVKKEIKLACKKGMFYNGGGELENGSIRTGYFVIHEDILKEATLVLTDALGDKGADREFASVMKQNKANGGYNSVMSRVEGPVMDWVKDPGAVTPDMPNGDISIHSHVTGSKIIGTKIHGSNANEPSEAKDMGEDSDENMFKRFKINIIVGKYGRAGTYGNGSTIDRANVINVFGNDINKKIGSIDQNRADKIVKKREKK